MDERLKEYIIKMHDDMSESSKVVFCRKLRDKPEDVKTIVRSRLKNWTRILEFDANETMQIIKNIEEISDEIVEVLKIYFNTKIEAL